MATYRDSKGQRRGFSLSIGLVDEINNRLGVDLLNFPECFAGLRKMDLLRLLWTAQGEPESFSSWFDAHKGRGFETLAEAFSESLCEFFPALDESRPVKTPRPVDVRQEAYKMSGILGIDCKGFTLRELLWMVEGKFPQVKDSRPANDGGSLKDLCIAMGGKAIES